MSFSFRPHHFLCTLGFQGKGYSPSFIENYKEIVDALQKNEEHLIIVVEKHDSICEACPHQTKGECEKEEKIQSLDNRHSRVLNITPGDVLSWREAKERIKSHMILDKFHQACAGCSWKSLGVCEKALKKLRREGDHCEE